MIGIDRLAKIFHHAVTSEKLIIDYLLESGIEPQVVYELKKHQEQIGMLSRELIEDVKEEKENNEL